MIGQCRDRTGVDLGKTRISVSHPWSHAVRFKQADRVTPADVSGWVFVLRVGASPVVIGTVTHGAINEIVMSLTQPQVAALGVGVHHWTLDEVSPENKPLLRGVLCVEQDI